MADRVYTGLHVVVDFDFDEVGMAKVAVGPELRDAVKDVVEHRALPYAKSISPVSRRKHKHYVDSFRVTESHVVIAGLRRVAARLWNVAPHAATVEWGNARTNGEGHRVLGRTVDHLHGV